MHWLQRFSGSEKARRPARRGLRVALLGLAAIGLGASAVSAQPVFVGVQTAVTQGNQTGLSVPVPAGAAGDLLIAIWGNAINPTTNIPAGFTAVTGFAGFNQAICPLPDIRCQLAVSYKIAAGTETTVDFVYGGTPGSPRAQVAAVLRYANASSANPIGPAMHASGPGSPVTAPSVNTTEANNLILRIGLAGIAQSNTLPAALTAGPMTERFNLRAGQNSDVGVSIAGSDAPQAAAGATGTATWNSSLEEWVAGTITIQEGGNSPPNAVCQNVTKSANASCQASVSATEVNNGSTDPDGDPLTFSLSPPGPFSLGSTPVTLTVSDGNDSDTCGATVTVNDNTDPVITLNGPSVVTLQCPAAYVEQGATAVDNCTSPVAVSISGSVDTNTPGSYTITYTANDGNGNSASTTRTVNVIDTIDPVITLNGPNPVTLECPSAYMEPGASALDACAGVVPVSIVNDVDETTPGSYTATYTASDGNGNTAMATRTVIVQDTLPPQITVSAGRLVLWPPNHKYQTIDLIDVVTDASDLCDLTIDADDVVLAEVSSDEEENASGDGNTVDDIVIAPVDCRSVDLRAERQGGNNGRVYTLDLEVTDASANVGTASSQVEVPHDKNATAADDGAVYSEISDCASFKSIQCGGGLEKSQFESLINAKGQCMAAAILAN